MIALDGNYSPAKERRIDLARHSPEVVANAIRIPSEGLKLIVEGRTLHVDAERAKKVVLALIKEEHPERLYGSKDWLKEAYAQIVKYANHCLTFGDEMAEHILNAEGAVNLREASKRHGVPYSIDCLLPVHVTHARPSQPKKAEYKDW